ncbi:MAG: hypothetical protein WA117_02450, partial [Verrucomicrobiia bacterium]
MNQCISRCAVMLIALGVFAGHAIAQSEHARKIAAAFAGTEHDAYAKDILVGKPDYVVFTPKLKREIVGDKYNDH